MKQILVINAIAVLAIRTAFASLIRRSSRLSHEDRHLFDNKIYGGASASAGEFPYFVEWVGCGATLIHSDILLSAAHCSGTRSNGVLVGGYKSFPYNSDNIASGAQFRTITARVVHPSFSSNTGKYDFMVLQLDSPVWSITPVTLKRNGNDPIVNDTLTTIGFGATSSSTSSSTILNKVNVNYLSSQTCQSDYSTINLDSSIQFCAGVPAGGKDTCQGDSGGPIINSQGVQVGVTSSGYGCGLAQKPGIYARVSAVTNWIDAQICALSANPPASCRSSGSGGGGGSPASPTPAPIPIPSPAPGSTSIRLDVMYDLSASETSWAIINSSTGKNAATSTSGKSNAVSRTYLQLAPGAYVLQFLDKGGDGFCCDYGVGYYALYMVSNGVYVALGQGSGYFQSKLNINFSIPPSNGPFAPAPSTTAPFFPTSARVPTLAPLPPTPPPFPPTSPTQAPVSPTAAPVSPSQDPTSPPTTLAPIQPNPRPIVPSQSPTLTTSFRCVDSTSATFPYNGTVSGTFYNGIQSCAWLSTRQPWMDLLCHPGQPAYRICPKTCGQCVSRCLGQDSPTATFLISGYQRNCAWLKTRPNLTTRQCAKRRPAYTLCKDTCNSC